MKNKQNNKMVFKYPYSIFYLSDFKIVTLQQKEFFQLNEILTLSSHGILIEYFIKFTKYKLLQAN